MRTGQSDLVGQLLEDRYRIDAPIARGGMSVVYRGLDTRLDRPVAIKVMDPKFAADPQFLARFEFEARAVAKLKHPGLVAVYDQGHDGDYAFLVMELVEGGTLRELLRERGPMPPHAVRAVAEPVLAALGVAHHAGLVHRDVKPENILISESGEVKIADFGLVRAIAGATTTSSNIILGTAAYLSPEQVTTGAADARSDVYAFGVMMFEMLTGRAPFIGDTSLSVAYQRIDNDVPRPGTLIGGIPPEFDALIGKATSRDPAGRFTDAAAMVAALQTVASMLQLPEYRVPAPHHGAAPEPATQHLAQAANPPTKVDTALAGPPTPATVPAVVAPTPTLVEPRSTAYEEPSPPSGYPPPPTPPPAAPLWPRQRPRAWHRKPLVWVAALLALALTLGIGGWLLAAGNYVTVPSVERLKQADAVETIQQAGFTSDVKTKYSDTRPVGQVLGTDPPSGQSAPKGSTVTILVSGGRPRVPQIKQGADPADVRQQIRDMDLRPIDGGKQYSSTVPAGTVLKVNPEPGREVPAGSDVKVIISGGPATGRIPDLRGQSVDQATALLTRLGVRVGTITDETGNPATDGTVASTDPAAGEGFGPESTVNLVVSAEIQVPWLMLKTVRDATQQLHRVGLQAAGQIDDERRLVTGQSPAAGSTVRPGTTIQLCTSFLGRGCG